MVGDLQGVFLANLGSHALDAWAVQQVVQRTVRRLEQRVVGEVGEPVGTIGTTGLGIARDDRVLVPEQMQFAVGGVVVALLGFEAALLAQRQQVEVATDQPWCALAFEFIQHPGNDLDLLALDIAARLMAVELGVEHSQLATVAQRQVAAE
ncbi:hypothetical protein D3C80_1640850 [compost metagenome]